MVSFNNYVINEYLNCLFMMDGTSVCKPNVNISVLIIDKSEIVKVKFERIFFLRLKPKLDEDLFKVSRLKYSTLVSTLNPHILFKIKG